MAVESYLPATGVKSTVEKQVKEKPSLRELTTIESPGKPIEASDLEKKGKTKRRRRKKPSSSNVKITQRERDSILIITEKPQAANKIANALGVANKYSENRVPYYELTRGGKKIIVCSAVGHIFNLTYKKGQKGWPIFETEWVPSYTNSKTAAFTKNYYMLLKKLAKRAKEVIIATDYDIEGEVIGWNVLRFIVQKDDAKRMKYSTLTKPELIKSYENLMQTLDWGHAYAGETRHLIDWLYGINLSRALMSAIKTSGSFKILSIGRVQGPTLKIIVDRDREIRSFKPKQYWQALAHANNLVFKHPKDIFKKSDLKPFKGISEALAKTTTRKESLSPPVPFDLTSLQREAHRWHRFSPSNTLKISQSLYLDGIISYPRTSSQKIPKEINPKSILEKLSRVFPEVKHASRAFPIEGPKSDPAHPSIYPTGEFKNLNGDEKKIYDLIAKRFISCFSENAETSNKRIVLHAEKEDKKFTTSGLTVLKKGWTNVYPTKLEETKLPDLDGLIKIDKMTFPEKETQPPKRYTAASLVSLLEKKNLGTKATRSMIVDTLFNRGYLDGRSIEPTPLGTKLIEALETYSPIIIDENLTRDLEEKMQEIQVSTSGFLEKEQKTIEQVKKLITDISKEFKAHEIKIGKKLSEGTTGLIEQQKQNNIIMPCVKCGKGNLVIKYSKKTKKFFVACDAYPECKETHSLPPGALIKTTDKKSKRGLPILLSIKKGKRPWEFEFNPNWREEQENKE